MRLPTAENQIRSRGQLWIGIGLAALVANAFLPSMPAISAMALVAWGATTVTLVRFRRSAGAYLVVAMNLVTYCGLYALFLGAMLHHIETHAGRLGILTTIDLVASVWPMSAVIAKSWHALRRCEPAA